MKADSFTSGDLWAVVNVDQRRSRSSPDLVPDLLSRLESLETALPPERTAGDEVQLITRSANTVVTVLEEAARGGAWRVGVGLGPVETPLPQTVRASRGPAFVAAREAVDAAHTSPSGLAFVMGEDPSGNVGGADYACRQRVQEAATVAALLHHLWSRRTKEGWDVVDNVRSSGSGRAAAAALGISASAVSQRLRTAGWQPGEQGRELLEQVLAELLGEDGAR